VWHRKKQKGHRKKKRKKENERKKERKKEKHVGLDAETHSFEKFFSIQKGFFLYPSFPLSTFQRKSSTQVILPQQFEFRGLNFLLSSCLIVCQIFSSETLLLQTFLSQPGKKQSYSATILMGFFSGTLSFPLSTYFFPVAFLFSPDQAFIEPRTCKPTCFTSIPLCPKFHLYQMLMLLEFPILFVPQKITI